MFGLKKSENAIARVSIKRPNIFDICFCMLDVGVAFIIVPYLTFVNPHDPLSSSFRSCKGDYDFLCRSLAKNA